MAIRLLQHYTPNFKPLIDISKPVHEEYCKRHGYSFHLKEVPQYEIYNGLEKLNQILEVCEDGDTALVMDADAMITNLLFRIERFIVNDKDLYLSEGKNCGIFIIRVTHWAKEFIKWILFEINSGNCQCEQDAIEKHTLYLQEQEIAILEHPCFNSYLSELYPEIPQPVTEEQGQWVEGSFILHLPALPLSQREEIMKNIKITI